MKKIISIALGSVLALSMVATAFASNTWKVVSNTSVVMMPADRGDSFRKKTYVTNSSKLKVLIPTFALGAFQPGLPNTALQVASIKTASNIHVYFLGAQMGASQDTVSFSVVADAGSKLGNYPVEVALTNPLTGDNGIIDFTTVVQ